MACPREGFSTLNANSGYWQIPVAEDDGHKTAFTCHAICYQFERCPLASSTHLLPSNEMIFNVLGNIPGDDGREGMGTMEGMPFSSKFQIIPEVALERGRGNFSHERLESLVPKSIHKGEVRQVEQLNLEKG